MNDLQNLIYKAANYARINEDYEAFSILVSLALDCGQIIQNGDQIKKLKVGIDEALTIKAELMSIGLTKLANEVDVIAKDLEARLIEFEANDPIEAVLSSYALIHKLASTSVISNPIKGKIKQILQMVETEVMDEEDLETLLLDAMKDLPKEDKTNIRYILEKDYQIDIPLEKIASDFDAKKIKEKLEIDLEEASEKEKELFSEKSKKIKQEFKDKAKEDSENYTWTSSFPSSPPMWGGFSYQAIVPYQQSSQINFWSLAADQEKILNRIARSKK